MTSKLGRRLGILTTVGLLTSVIAVAPAGARPTVRGYEKKSQTTTVESTTTTSQVTLDTSDHSLSTAEVERSTFQAGSLYDVAARIGLVDFYGNPLVKHTGAGVTIAMIDTGVVDVAGLQNSNVAVGPDFSFEDQYPELRGLDTNGHGTHMAGIMVATDDAWKAGDTTRRPDRVLGIAPDAVLLSVKAGSADGGVDVTQIIAAINWVIQQKTSGTIDIDVLNLSFSVDSSNHYWVDPLAHAVERAWNAGIVVVVAAGNEGDDWTVQNPATDPFVIAVGASELEAEREASTDFTSGTSSDRLDVRAPGRSIISLRVPGAWYEQYNEAGRVGDDLVRGSGTSQAAAVVSGAVAILLEARPDLTPDEVKAILRDSSWVPASTSVGWEAWSESNERYLRLDAALDTPTPKNATQTHHPSDGSKWIDGTRGWVPLVSIDGFGLTGDQDIFGHDWSDSAWAIDSWTNNTWNGGSWAGGSWAGGSWAGGSWATDMWTGGSWAGGSWAGGSWAGMAWAGGSWAGGSWAGGSWAGGSWAGGSWAGASWN